MGGAGVGKEVAARLLHGWSQRANAPFVIVSAARMTPERVEEELFGVEEGGDLVRPGSARTGAWRHAVSRRDRRHADRDAGAHPARADRPELHACRRAHAWSRSMCASSPRPRATCGRDRRGRFREDLYYRLNVVPVAIPPLADRREDIPRWSIISSRITQPNAACRRRMIAPDAMVALQSYEWPGNVRQLAQRRRTHDHPGAGRPDRADRSRSAACRKCWAIPGEIGGDGRYHRDHGRAAA